MDQLVTIFGGGGFLGRYVAQELIGRGARIRVASRDPKAAWFLKPLGALGQTQFVAANVTKPQSVARTVEGADAVINLVGVLKGDFEKVHVEGAGAVAAAAAAAGAKALVHVSAIGADPEAASAYARTKGLGEEAVRGGFSTATILRPSIVFGAEDEFVNRFAGMIAAFPVMPVVKGSAKFQPAWAGDVGAAIATAALDPAAHGGATVELGGPQVISMAELNAWIAETIASKATIVPIPDPIAAALARFGGWLPGAPITWDQWLMLQHDNVASGDGFARFGITPKPLAAIAPRYLVRYRREGRFSLNAAA